MILRIVLLICTLLFSIAGIRAQVVPRVLVGPNILVSREGEQNREVAIAADPTNPKRLLGAADVITPSGRYSGRRQRLYLSVDRGNTWRPIRILEPDSGVEIRALDPHVEFAPDGTAFFIGLPDNNMVVYRSTNGGTVWEKATFFPETTNFRVPGNGYDYELLTFDHTGGKFAGRSYISVMLKSPSDDYPIAVFRSDDGWRTRSGPVIVHHAKGSGGGANSRMLQTFSDGTVALVLDEWGADKIFTLKLATSEDGGASFSAPRLIPGSESRYSWHAAAIDNSFGPYRDRIYVVFEQGNGPVLRQFPSDDPTKNRRTLMFMYSEDHGRTWSKARPLDPNAGPMSDQFTPAMAINRDGVVAVTWYDTRNTSPGAKGTLMDYYMTASVDGGKSFLSPVRVSSESTDVRATRNVTLFAAADRGVDTPRIRFRSGDATGGYGHYMSLTADVEGVFHPFWQDGRTGIDQIWTARVEVHPGKSRSPTGSIYLTEIDNGESRPEPTREVAESDLSTYITPCVDTFRPSASPDILEVPIRFKNVSNRSIYGPLKVEVSKIEEGTSILNSTNGKNGVGATLDYGGALGDFETLPPDGVTNAVVWRFRRSKDVDRSSIIASVVFRVFGKIDKSRIQAPPFAYCD